jgi:hypothetical protein
MQVGGVVLVKDEHLPLMRWNLGIVVAVHSGQDGLVRTVMLKFE